MAYSTTADVQTAAHGERNLRSLSDVDGNNAVNTAVVESAIAEADALINSYVQKRHRVPLSPVPVAIKHLSARIAVYLLKQHGIGADERDQAGHQRDLDWLEAVSTGQVTLGVTPLPEKSVLVAAEQGNRPESKVVSRRKLRGFW